MQWVAILGVIWEFLKPFLEELLKRLLEQTASHAGPPDEADPAASMAALFAEAEKELPRWQVGKRLKLRAAKRAAICRAPEIFAAAKAAHALAAVPPLTAAERAEFADLAEVDEVAPPAA